MKIIVTTSTFPAHHDDHVPSFVLEQVRALARLHKSLKIYVLIPHHSYMYGESAKNVVKKESHIEVRYHYFYPFGFETLTGRGILPALKENPIRFLLIPFLLLAQRVALMKLCRRLHPDILYAHWFTPQAIIANGVSKKYKIPLMFTTHAADVAVLHKVPFGRKIVQSVLNQASVFTAVSMRTARKVMAFCSERQWQEYYANKMSIIPMGTQVDYAPLSTEVIATCLSKCGVNQDKKILLSLGRLSEKKGLKYLIEAYAALPVQIQDQYQLVLAGDGQLLSSLQKLVRRYKLEHKVVFAGYVNGDEKQALLLQADIFILPSIIDDYGDSEGLPVALMEALSLGKVVIATNVSGAEEILDRQTGFLVEQKSAAAIEAAINNVLGLTEEQIKEMQNSALLLSKQFSWDNVAQRHYHLLSQLINNPKT